jgi:uridine phosphorylase
MQYPNFDGRYAENSMIEPHQYVEYMAAPQGIILCYQRSLLAHIKEKRAIRDEGTSHHYLSPGKYAYPSKPLTERLGKVLKDLRKEYHLGTSWTIDALYRETVAEARHDQQDGVATVEMEASALFAVAEHRKVDIAALFTISDSLADLKWRPEFHSLKTREGLEIMYRAALTAF